MLPTKYTEKYRKNNLDKEAVQQTVFLFVCFLQIPENLDERRNDIDCACRTQDQACQKTRKMRVFPNPENAERPVNPDRNHRQKQPKTRQGFDLVNFANQWIDQKAEK